MLKRTMSAIAAAIGIRELMLFAGIGLAAYGAWLVYVPAGFVVPGALLIVTAMLAR